MGNVHLSKAQIAGPYMLLLTVFVLTILPILLALSQLMMVSDWTFLEFVEFIGQHSLFVDTLRFTILQAVVSATVALCIGIPIAWLLSRYSWKHKNILRSVFTLPFITPSIVAAAGFLAMSSDQGILQSIGIDLQSSEHWISKLGSIIGIEKFGMILLLIFAHAWFNISLFIRYLEPRITTLHPDWEMQFLLLPMGRYRWYRFRHFWLPFLGGSMLTAWLFSFFFSFTSFAMIRWLTPTQHSLESLSATFGQFAGIEGYRLDATRLVLASTILQFLALSLVFLLFHVQREKMNQSYKIISEQEHFNRQEIPPFGAKALMWGLTGLVLLPYISILASSFQIRSNASPRGFYWTFEAWEAALFGHFDGISVFSALANSLLYAGVTILVVLPLTLLVSFSLLEIERRGHQKIAHVMEFMCIFPVFISAVTLGLGISIGMISFAPSLLQWRMLPAIPHIFLTFPFALRIVHPALQRIDVRFFEQAKLLRRSIVKSYWLGFGIHLKSVFIVVISLSFAFSVGEFGASFLVVRFESWSSLSLLVDTLLSRPKFDPIAYPLSMVVATILMILTFTCLVIIDRAQAKRGESK
jgi:thiamine transport system permease protein